MIIDSHHHFWKYNAEEYGWLSGAKSTLRRDFLPQDLTDEIARAKVDGVVSVQARQTLQETDWLLEIAAQTAFVRGVVGWLPFADSQIESLIEEYSSREKLVGLRHVVEAESDGFLDGGGFNRGIAKLQNKLVYDILITERQLEETIRFVDRHPGQSFVLDHVAKPLIKDGVLAPWRDRINELARRENVSCKISGMTTEADYINWTPQQLQPYYEIVLEAFGANRLMFGSDWPVSLVACDYSRWLETVRGWIAPLSHNEQAQILGGNAIRIYDL